MSTFSALGIRPEFVKSLKEIHIVEPSPIQEEAIPILLGDPTDFIGLAQTGTGKTAAYGLPLLHKIDPSIPEVQGLILSPTRELVQQIKKQLFKFTKYSEEKIFAEAVYGGEKIDKQIKALQRPTHIVVATPGRLIDLIEKGAVNLENIHTLILDEADEMLSMGFKQELSQILKYTSGNRKTWLFSATMSEEIQEIVKKYLSPKAQKVSTNKTNTVNSKIKHEYILTTVDEKVSRLSGILDRQSDAQTLIFCRTKAGTQKLAKELKAEGFSVDALEGDMTQKDRDKVMRAFKNKSLQHLVSTDVAARGIDVRDLGLVLHHQLPDNWEYYTHRSGRTARAGNKGLSIALVTANEMDKMKTIQQKLGIRFQEVK